MTRVEMIDEAWSTLNDHQSRARFLTWQLYRSMGR